MVANRREIRYRTANLLQADNDGTRLLNSFATVPKTATTYGDITVSPTGMMTVDALPVVGDGGLTEVNFTTADNTKLDGIETNATADQTASEILTLIKTVDGSGSGLDADTLDGETSSAFLRSNADATVTGEITGSGDPSLSGFFLPQNPEGRHVKAPWFFNDMAYARLKGATVTVTVTGGSAPSNSSIDAILDASTSYWSVSTTGVTEVVIEITNPPKTMRYGSHMGATFGQTAWRAKDIKLESYYNGQYNELLNVSDQAKEYATISYNTGSNAQSKLRWTFSNFNSTSMRIVSLFAYNYDSVGMPSLYLTNNGGTMYGDISMAGSQTVDGRDVSVDGSKLDGIDNSANNYTHPNNHAISVVTGLQTELNLKATSVALTASEALTKEWVGSRGENLFSNGSLMLGDNTNMTSFTFDGAEAYNSAGSLSFSGAGTKFSDEFMPVDSSKKYKVSVDAKTLGGLGRYYMMTTAYDVDGYTIGANNCMYRANTATTLAVELKAGDTTVTLAGNGSNYLNTGTSGVQTHLRSLIFWEYTNSFGFTYLPETYSRLWYNNMWDPGGVSGNVITLLTPWAGPTYPVGSKLSNGSSGGSYKYNVMAAVYIPTAWTSYAGYMDGTDYTGTNVSTKFPPGTAKVKLGWLLNYQGSGETVWFTNLKVAEAPFASVDDTSDADKPVSIATQTALDLIPTPADAIELSSSIDLDDLNQAEAGFYYQNSNADTTGNNYPSGEAGSLIVQKCAGEATQMYQTYSSAEPRSFFRSNYTTGWGAWREIWHSGNSSQLTTALKANYDSAHGWGDHASAGYAAVAGNSSTTGKTLLSSDMNSTINATGTITVNNSVATAGDIVIVHNSTAGGISINDGSDGASGITTMRLAGTATTGTRTLAQRGVAFLYFATATEVVVGGSGVS